jgi:hypothetical protein
MCTARIEALAIISMRMVSSSAPVYRAGLRAGAEGRLGRHEKIVMRAPDVSNAERSAWAIKLHALTDLPFGRRRVWHDGNGDRPCPL